MTERVRALQVEAIEHVINRLYDEIRGTRYSTEHCSLLLLDYRRAEATLRARPNVGAGAAAFTMADDVKRESYGIEMGIIQDMFEAGDISERRHIMPEAMSCMTSHRRMSASSSRFTAWSKPR